MKVRLIQNDGKMKYSFQNDHVGEVIEAEETFDDDFVMVKLSELLDKGIITEDKARFFKVFVGGDSIPFRCAKVDDDALQEVEII